MGVKDEFVVTSDMTPNYNAWARGEWREWEP